MDSLYVLWAGNMATESSGHGYLWTSAYRSTWYNSPAEWNRKVTGYIFVPGSTVWSSAPPLVCNVNSLTHETGHLLGLNDYYSYDTSQRQRNGLAYSGGAMEGGLGGMDMMDANIADHNAFNLYEATEPSVSKGNGTITYADGVYTLNYTTSVMGMNTTTFTYEDETITFTSFVLYGTSYLKNKDFEFVTHTASLVKTQEDAKLQAGEYEANFKNGEMDCEADLTIEEDGTYEYSIAIMGGMLNFAEKGTYEVNGNAVIFTPTEAKEGFVEWNATFEGTTITAQKQLTEKNTNTKEMIFTPKAAQEPETPEEPQVPTLQAGEYVGTYEKATDMGTVTVVYNCTLVINEDNTYEYAVNFAMMGSEYNQSENGTYTYDGTTVTFTTEAPIKEGFETSTATVDGDSLVVTRLISSFANAAEEVVVTK